MLTFTFDIKKEMNYVLQIFLERKEKNDEFIINSTCVKWTT